MKFHAASLALFCATGLAMLAGCGGSDSSGGGGGGGTQTPTNIFITDDLHAGYDGVWVTIHAIELVHANGNTATVFESDEGETVNLRALNDGSARFLFLSQNRIPNGAYHNLRVTMDTDLTLYPTGASNGTPAQFASSFDIGSGMSRIDLNMSPPFVVSANTDDLVIDFDLAAWQIAGNVVTPVIDVHTGNGLGNDDRHDRRDYKGTVSNLSGTIPNQTFTLTTRTGSFRVQMSDDTVVFRNNGSTSASLANGQRVDVRGTFSTATNMLLASRIKIKDQSDGDDEPEVHGMVSDTNTVAGTFKVTTDEVWGFQPSANFVNVATTDNTVYFSDSGMTMTKEVFFATLLQLGSNARVEVEGGTYVSGTNTLTARKIKLEDDDDNHEVEARGRITTINEAQSTMAIVLQEWQGFQAETGLIVTVKTNASTEFRDGNGQIVSSAAFYALLNTETVVKTQGELEGGTITAAKIEIKP